MRPGSATAYRSATAIYRTTDGGDTWEHLGLESTERIAKIAVDPTDSDTVYVCATGQLWSANAERGVYKTTDGGANWEQIFFIDENTGCSDLDMDPQEPGILYAAMWQFRRYPRLLRIRRPGERALSIDRRRRELVRAHQRIARG